MSERFDLAALKQGGSVALMIAVPLTLIARFVSDGNANSGWAPVLALGSFFGFLLGAGVAAWHQTRSAPLSHGLVTALGAFVLAQAVFVVVRVAQGKVIHWGKISVGLALCLGAGLVGGWLGSFLQRRGVTPYR